MGWVEERGLHGLSPFTGELLIMRNEKTEPPFRFLFSRQGIHACNYCFAKLQPGLSAHKDIFRGDGLERTTDTAEVDQTCRAHLAQLVAVPDTGGFDWCEFFRQPEADMALDGMAYGRNFRLREVRAMENLRYLG